MAYCTLEEAWGQDYKSFLSPASLTPDWLGNCKEMQKIKGEKNVQKQTVEHFTSNTASQKPKDNDLLIDYDEFNLPLYFDAPKGIDSVDDNYYKLIDNQFQENFENTANTSYLEEDQFGEHYTRECDQAFPLHVKYHLKKCKLCRKRVKSWLDELDADNNNNTSSLAHSLNSTPSNTISTTDLVSKNTYLDLVFFIAIGIFLIFVLDSFVRLGRSFSRR